MGAIAAELANPTKPKGVNAPTKPQESNFGGRPRRDVTRMHVSIDRELANYLERAWRAHERPDGSLASGPSAFVEDLLTAHREAKK